MDMAACWLAPEGTSHAHHLQPDAGWLRSPHFFLIDSQLQVRPCIYFTAWVIQEPSAEVSMELLEGFHRGESSLAAKALLEPGPYDAIPPGLVLESLARGHARWPAG